MNLKDARLLLEVANAVALEENLDGQLAPRLLRSLRPHRLASWVAKAVS